MRASSRRAVRAGPRALSPSDARSPAKPGCGRARERAGRRRVVVTLPTLLPQTGYSRGFEDDADTCAFERLKALGIAPRAFADALTALERAHASQSGASADSAKALPDYLSTHPSTQRRIQRALSAE